MRSEWDVAEALKSGQLVHVLPQWGLAPADVVALVPQRKGMSARVKAFIAFANEHFFPCAAVAAMKTRPRIIKLA